MAGERHGMCELAFTVHKMPLITLSLNSIPIVAFSSNNTMSIHLPVSSRSHSLAVCFCVDPVCLVPPDAASVDLPSICGRKGIESLSEVALPVGQVVIRGHGNGCATA
jgi:hypothetical protein